MRFFASVLRCGGFFILVLSLPVGVLTVGLFRIEGYHVTVLAIPVAIVALGAFALFRGRQLAARRISSALLEPGQPTVLYLRGFDTDVTPRRATATATLQYFVLVQMITGLVEGWATEEEQLADALEPVGTLVAIGKPGEPLPLPGARRTYVGDDWRRAVIGMMAAARLTIIRPSLSPGVVWELECARHVLTPERLLILVSDDMSRSRYDEIARAGEQLLRVRLPTWDTVRASARTTVFGRSGYIYFMPGGHARFVPVHAPQRYARGLKPQRQMLRYSFLPVFQALRVPWTPLKHVGGCLAIVLLMVGLFLGFVGIVVAAYFLTSGFHRM